MRTNVEVLCATMNQTDFSKYKEMNLSTDVVFANQTNETSYTETVIQGHSAKMISTETCGVGRNRNLAIMYASGDILLFADDDIRYKDDYAQQVENAYKQHPDADMIIFSLEYTRNGQVFRFLKNKNGRIRFGKGLKNGTCVYSVRKAALMKSNIWFSMMFGGGTDFAHGEDTLFLLAAKKKMKVYGSSYSLGYCSKDSSTCFSGYNEKYFFDQGVLYAAAFGYVALPMAIQFCIRKRDKYCKELSIIRALLEMRKGISFYGQQK